MVCCVVFNVASSLNLHSREKSYKRCIGVLCMRVNFNNLQILGCEEHQNAFGGPGEL